MNLHIRAQTLSNPKGLSQDGEDGGDGRHVELDWSVGQLIGQSVGWLDSTDVVRRYTDCVMARRFLGGGREVICLILMVMTMTMM